MRTSGKRRWLRQAKAIRHMRQAYRTLERAEGYLTSVQPFLVHWKIRPSLLQIARQVDGLSRLMSVICRLGTLQLVIGAVSFWKYSSFSHPTIIAVAADNDRLQHAALAHGLREVGECLRIEIGAWLLGVRGDGIHRDLHHAPGVRIVDELVDGMNRPRRRPFPLGELFEITLHGRVW